MLTWATSATGLLKCRFHAEPTVMMVSISVPVISAAPCAINLAASYISITCS